MKARNSVVYVVDDDPSVGRSIERLIRSAGHEARVFTSASDFLDSLDPGAPSCLVLDVDMPAVNGLELQQYLADKSIHLPIVFITGHGTVSMSVKAMKAGAVDFLPKPFTDTDLLDAVARAVEADRQARQEREHLASLRGRLKALTPRERDVFRLVVQGLLNKQIAFELGTAEKTVKVHRARVMTKLGAQSVADLVRFADKLGMDSLS